MTKSIAVIAAGLLSVFVAGATDVPRYEVFLGYTYVRANQFNQNTGLGQEIGGFDMNGGSAQFIYNFNKKFSGVADIGSVTKGNVGVINADNTTTFYMFGPRYSFRSVTIGSTRAARRAGADAARLHAATITSSAAA